MSMNILGRDPKSERGQVFECTSFAWWELWTFAGKHCRSMTANDREKGWLNQGYRISREKAERIADAVEKALPNFGVTDLVKTGKQGSIKKMIKEATDLAKDFIAFARESGGFEVW
jgi:hypothetical protein